MWVMKKILASSVVGTVSYCDLQISLTRLSLSKKPLTLVTNAKFVVCVFALLRCGQNRKPS